MEPAQNQIATITESKLPGWLRGFSEGTLEQAQAVATLLSKSDLVPKIFVGKPGDILIAGAMGARLGMDLFSSLAGIAPINGRASIWGDAMLAVCQNDPSYVDIKEVEEGEGDAFKATCTVMRRGREPYTKSFSMKDAAVAGLKNKQGPWSTNPKRMCMMRARSFALRGAFADRLAGFLSTEEAEDIKEVEGTVVPEPVAAKARPGRPTKEAQVVKDAIKEADAERKAAETDKIIRPTGGAGLPGNASGSASDVVGGLNPPSPPSPPAEKADPIPGQGDLFDEAAKPEPVVVTAATPEELKAEANGLYQRDTVSRNHMLAVFAKYGVKALMKDCPAWTPERRGQMMTELKADPATWKATP